MDTASFARAYNETRNGTDGFTRHPLVRSFYVSDGVVEVADAGVWWLIDIAATELPAVLKYNDEHMGILTADVMDSAAELSMTGSGDRLLWARKIEYTDMPNGEWKFLVARDDSGTSMILLSEY